MRKIKFRAWDKGLKYMLMFDSHNSGVLYSCGEFMVSSGYNSYNEPTFEVNTSDCFDIMENTEKQKQDSYGIALISVIIIYIVFCYTQPWSLVLIPIIGENLR